MSYVRVHVWHTADWEWWLTGSSQKHKRRFFCTFLAWEKIQLQEVLGRVREGGCKNKLRCVTYKYQLPTRSVFIVYHKHVLVKKKKESKVWSTVSSGMSLAPYLCVKSLEVEPLCWGGGEKPVCSECFPNSVCRTPWFLWAHVKWVQF